MEAVELVVGCRTNHAGSGDRGRPCWADVGGSHERRVCPPFVVFARPASSGGRAWLDRAEFRLSCRNPGRIGRANLPRLDGGNSWEVIMKIQFKTLFVLLSVALNVAFVGGWVTRSFRAPGTGLPSSGGTPAAMPVLYQKLGATEQQWQQLRPQFEAFRESALAVFTRINQRRQELLALLADPQADRASISEKQKEVRAAQTQMQDLVISHVLAERVLLTSAQRQRYFELLAQRSGMLCENLMEGLRPATSREESRPAVPPTKE